MMSIPFLVLIAAAILWLALNFDGGPAVRAWAIRVCELLFAAAAFALMFSLVRTTVG